MKVGTNRSYVWVAGAMAAGLAASLLVWPSLGLGLTPDSYEYMRGGIAIWSGDGFKSMEGTKQVLFPPLYPILIGATNRLLHDPVLSGRVVSLCLSAAAILLFFLLARAVLPGRAAVLAAWLLALLPVRVVTSTMVWSESTFLALALAGLLLWTVGPARSWPGLLCGLALGAAYLARTEGLLVFGVLMLGVVLWPRAHERTALPWARIGLAAVGFVVVSAPYVCYLRSCTGHWQLSGKTQVNLQLAAGRANDVPWEQLFVLSEDNREVVPREFPEGRTQLARRVAKSARGELVMLAQLVSPFLLACLGLGLAQSGPVLRRSGAVPVLAALASPLLVLPFFFLEDRYLLVSTLPLLVLAASALPEPGPASGERALGPHRRVMVWLLACTLLWTVSDLGMRTLQGLRHYGRTASLAQKSEPVVVAVNRFPHARGPIVGHPALGFYTGRDSLPVPWAQTERVVKYARLHHASFLCVRELDHPSLAALSRRPVATPDLVPVARDEGAQLYLIRPSARARP